MPETRKPGGNAFPVDEKPSLAHLAVLERLVVGPVRLEPDRVETVYRVERMDGTAEETSLVFRFEEPVFDMEDPACLNLGAMMTAQVALNYGLFCREIVFNGPFDTVDQRFLTDMMENTSREIYVKKLLEPNPFLLPELKGMPVSRMPRYTNATIRFEWSETAGKQKFNWRLWKTERARHMVLSSGGKDSLLTFGLLRELDREVHPVFVNESGRHWFTALNAYRYFRENIPGTGRVWVNSDRVFAFMLRQLPFIRQDFSSVRSDEYPIRLWTVAVFLFGVLPLARKRGTGRILIGDEYDTTRRASFRGIPHYDGLYDQSRYFDNALSRYFLRKGWSTSVMSILRPLSEMLIESILASRYPDLQQHQISCHAAHKADERIRPCGKCEKCRRIVGMLKALDHDPTQCGYTGDQITACLRKLEEAGVHQEAAGVEHLNHLLTEKGLIRPVRRRPRAHPEILKLRFDPERAPVNGIPLDLRNPLYRIWMQYAQSVLMRRGRKWEQYDPLQDPNWTAGYAFETDASSAGQGDTRGPHLWAELTWPEAEERLKRVDIALLPVGSIEQHGPHLPLDTDAYDAGYLARRVAEACSDPRPFLLPLVPYGVSHEHDDFKGTISVRNDTLASLVYDIGMSTARNGIRKLVILNGHGGNGPALNYAAQMINRDAQILVCVDSGEASDVDIYRMVETPNDIHAGEVETSTSLALRPEKVRLDLAVPFVPEFSNRYLNYTSKRGISWYSYTRRISETGVLGDPSRASAEKGRRIWEVMIAHLVALVEDLKSLTLEEIYQRRY